MAPRRILAVYGSGEEASTVWPFARRLRRHESGSRFGFWARLRVVIRALIVMSEPVEPVVLAHR
jgi:hypothetical protein